MEVGRWFVTKIKQAAETRRETEEKPKTVTGRRGAVVITAELTEADKLSAQFHGIKLTCTLDRPLPTEQFEQLIRSIEKRVIYLPEHLLLVEKDDAQQQAILRSKNPRKRGKAVEFFEIRVSPQISLSLRRYRNLNHKNEVVDFILSYDIVERLVEDMVALVVEISAA